MRHRLLAFLMLAGCGSVGDHATDAAKPPDAATSAVDATVVDAPPAPTPAPPGLAQTAGGGAASSVGHRIQIRIGAPEPLGRAQSGGHGITTGPGAMPWAHD